MFACREYRRPPKAEIMDLWRQRVGDCIGFDWDRTVQVSSPTIIVIDRAWNASRHIVNVNYVMSSLERHYPQARVELHYLEHLSLKQQAVIYNKASIVMWVHGASMANLIFLPRQAAALHVVPRPHIQENIDWPEELVRDLSNDVSVSTSWLFLPHEAKLCLLMYELLGCDRLDRSVWSCSRCPLAPCLSP